MDALPHWSHGSIHVAIDDPQVICHVLIVGGQGQKKGMVISTLTLILP